MAHVELPRSEAEVRPPLLRIRGLSKRFPGLVALEDLSLEVAAGEIVAVVGQNGSGKSTLVKILAGLHKADRGTIELLGADGAHGPRESVEVHFIHQDLGLIQSLSTIENLDIGHHHGLRGLLPAHRHTERVRAEQLVHHFGAHFDVEQPVATLTAAERAIVAIARALEAWTRHDNVLVLDEPTASLAADEVERLFEAVRRVAAGGAGVIFISHRLDEVMELTDRIVALRDGHVVADVAARQVDHDALVRLIAGRALEGAVTRTPAGAGEPVVAVHGLAGGTVVHVDMELRAGEIVGVSGLLGSGREHVGGLLFGAVRRTGGEITVAGRRLTDSSPRDAIACGVGFVPADRCADGIVLEHSVRENLTLPLLASQRHTMVRLDQRAERIEARDWVRRVDLDPEAIERPLRLLSGGSQQKVVLAKWLRTDARVLVLDEPTQGIDVGAKAAIYELVATAAARGAAVLICSSDNKELSTLCDRVLVMRGGVVAAELEATSLDEQQLLRAGLGLVTGSTERPSGAPAGGR